MAVEVVGTASGVLEIVSSGELRGFLGVFASSGLGRSEDYLVLSEMLSDERTWLGHEMKQSG